MGVGMKATGIVKRIDHMGRIVVPREIRNVLHMNEGMAIEMFVNEDEQLILQVYRKEDFEERRIIHCPACGKIMDFDGGKFTCSHCGREFMLMPAIKVAN
jgi:AbrB family looped-hinge helix DNA binding protein